MAKQLHIVAFDVPYPPHYGGAVEVFYKIKALAELGAGIHLHCFLYRDRKPAAELQRYCEQVHYYRRRLSPLAYWSLRPFIVQTRRAPLLLENLRATRLPILFEGIHTCGFIDHPDLAGRQKLVRMHNVEWQYYANLARILPFSARKTYLLHESRKLKSFEPQVVAHADRILTISANDQSYFAGRTDKARLIPAFHGCPAVAPAAGAGKFALFHGNLSVPDNEKAAVFLISNVFAGLDYPLVVAGKNPTENLKRLCRKFPAIRLVDSPGDAEMEHLLQEAQMNVLWTYQADGIKIKLLRALHQGRHCIVNPGMVAGTGLEPLCHLAGHPAAARALVTALMDRPLAPEEISLRRKLLDNEFNDRKNAGKILELLDHSD